MLDHEIRINPRKAWLIVALLFCYSVINFFDKLVLGLAAVPIMKELALTPAQYGLVASSFYWLYAVSGVVVGLFVINRVKPKWLLLSLVLVWSLAQAPIAFSSSLTVLVVCRILLGMGEGPGTPSAYDACHGWFPSDKRNLPTAIIIQGTSVGFLVGAPVLSHVIMQYGWRPAFLLCSGLGLVWIVAWAVWGEDGPISLLSDKTPSRDSKVADTVPWTVLWFDRTMIGSYVLGFGSYWLVGLSVAWLAPYLQMALGYDGKTVGWIISAMHAAQPPIVLAISYLSERALRGGMTSNHARALVNAACLVVGGVLLAVAMSIQGAGFMKVAILAVGFVLPMMTFVLGPAIVSEVAPIGQRGTALLVTYSIITISGLISPVVMGFSLQAAGPGNVGAGYSQAFIITSAVLICTGVLGYFLLDPEASKRRFGNMRAANAVSANLAPRAA